MAPRSSGKRESGIRAVVLDAVGTLIEPRPSVADAYAGAARRQGVELAPAEVKSRFHVHFGDDEVDEMRGPMATDEPTESRRWRRIVARVLPEVPNPERAFAELWDHFAQAGAWVTFEDVPGALRQLESAGLMICVASNFDGRLRSVLAGHPSLAGLVDSAVISSEVGYRKPHPEFYRAACRRLQLLPGEVVFVGDDPENDYRGPERSGCRSVLLDREGRHRGEHDRVVTLDHLVDHLREGEWSSVPHAGEGPPAS